MNRRPAFATARLPIPRRAIPLTALVLPLVFALGATSALAAPATRQYVLPGPAVFPEGIAFEESTGDFFVSSTTDGSILRANVADDTAHTFIAGGTDGRTTAIGVAVDRNNRLFIAGGGTGSVWVYDSTTRDLLARFTTPAGTTFLNDVAIDRSGDAYVTDSLRPIIWRITAQAVAAANGGTVAAEPWLDLTGTAITYQPGFNLNGIEATADGRSLVTVQSNTGALFRIDIATRTPSRIDLGGETVPAGDGLLLLGRTLYVAQNALGVIARIGLDGALTAGNVISRTGDPTLRFPTTIDFARGRLLVVNSQFNKRGPGLTPELPFTVSSIPLP
jgi:Cu-Zn family superoxide dismutase